jgi:(1->4)-alpha-D-glucan 1-alpha-D-glucosylmutase
MTQQDPVSPPAIAPLAAELAAARHEPNATYRIQFHPGFTFEHARAIVAYLRELGVSELYASPLFAARAGSTHGYDVADYGKLNPALGGDEGFAALSAALREAGLGLILDMVPNHMGIGDTNPWWTDVLENGPASPYADFFDIEWEPVKPELAGKVLLPILGDQYGIVLERGELKVALEDGALVIRYYDTRLPTAPRTILPVLEAAREAVSPELPEDDADRQELESIITALGYLPPRTETDPERLAERRREKEVIRRRIVALCERSAPVCAAIERAAAALNGDPGDPRSFDALDAVIERQPYRLAYWRVAAEEINYRRFFDINELAAVRVERPEVFAAAHELVFRLVGEGKVHGLRIDHPDGMWDPPAYFAQLQERFVLDEARRRGAEPDEAAADAARAWSRSHAERTARGEADWPLYVVAEKILSEREPLPHDWAVDGTTGYDFLNLANGIFVDGANEAALDAIYRRFISPASPASAPSFAAIVRQAKGEIMEGNLSSEITSLSHQLERINEKNRRYRDFTLRGLTGALTAILAELSIYRTYITDPSQVSERDVRYVLEAVHAARRRHPHIPGSLFTFLRDTMLLRNLHEFRAEDRPAVVDVVMRMQQITGPVMAKSVEDTAFYRYHRLVSLNEVGGHPEQFGHGVDEFHRQNAERARFWPHAMLTLATHDTKRGEDVRARINVLSELPGEWEAAVARWAELNAPHRRQADDEIFPDREAEYLLYQSLVGVWPDEDEGRLADAGLAALAERVAQYMQKATREAKLHTSWINPNEEYDAALAEFVQAILSPATAGPFLDDLAGFARRVAAFGRVNSLAQTLLKLSAPGVPDTYQGAELWDLSLVDPDNRRPVDYELRRRHLAELRERSADDSARQKLAAELLAHSRDGRVKLYLTAEALRHRREHPRLYADGSYTALEATGAKAAHVCAFARALNAEAAIVVAPRLVVGLTGGDEAPPVGAVWGDTALALPPELAGARLRDVLSGRVHAPGAALPLAELLGTLPVALLERVG